MRKVRNLRSKKGFSLAEVLIVVAIIGILLAVAIPNVLAYYRALKLTELDDSARTIFLAAQNRITALKNQGVDLETLGKKSDHVIRTRGAGGAGVNYYFIGTDNIGVDTGSSDGKLRTILPGGSIDTQLQGNHYVVEFDPTTGAVYAVWYWENGKFNYNTDAYKENRVEKPGENKDSRLPYMVGYYGGTTINREEVNQMPIPQVDITNAEELRVNIKMPSISGVTEADVKVSVLIDGVEIIKDQTLFPVNAQGTVVLDTLKPGDYTEEPAHVPGTTNDWIAGDRYKNWKTNNGLLKQPGEDITVTVVASYDGTLSDGSYLIPQSVSATVNSLFEEIVSNGSDPETYTAKIAYGRHLQNLHKGVSDASSDVTDVITAALQTRDIDFIEPVPTGADSIYYWLGTYPTTTPGSDNPYERARVFHALYNINITLYNGDGKEIRYMHAQNDDGYSGFFSYSAGMRFEGVNLVNPQIHAEDDPTDPDDFVQTGGLVGQGTDITINNCSIYSDVDFTSLDLSNLNTNESLPGGANNEAKLGAWPHIGAPQVGSSVGGFISWAIGDTTITNSHVSMILVGAAENGGFIGKTEGNVTIKNSYSACFIYGNRNTGGLIGLTKGDVTIKDSYVAGEIMCGYPVGFVGSGLFNKSGSHTYDVTNSYAAVRYINANGVPIDGDGETSRDTLNKTAGTIYGTYNGDDSNYYVKQSGVKYGYNDHTDETKYVACGIAFTTNDLAKKVGDAAGGFASGAWYSTANPAGVTHPYKLIAELKKDDSLSDPYPYPMLKVSGGIDPVPHYGDWLENKANGSLVNWEAYPTTAGGTEYGVWGYIGTDSGVQFIGDNTLLKGKAGDTVLDYAVADGYGVLVKREADGSSIAPTVTDSAGNPVVPTIVTGYKFTYDGSDYDLYTIPAPDYTAPGATEPTDYYTEVDVNGTVFLYNPDFACEVFLKDEHPDAPAAPLAKEKVGSTDGSNAINADANNVVIRTARQLANMAYYTNLTGLGTNAQTWIYNQLLDIDYGKYTGDGLDGRGSETTPQTPATLIGDTYSVTGTYNGNSYEIRHLYITGNGNFAGLFGQITNALISNVRLVNVNVLGTSSKNVGGLAGNASNSTINNCGIYVEDEDDPADGVDDEYNDFCITGMQSATGSDNFTGGLVGCFFSGSAENSFASVKVSGGHGTGGFAGLTQAAKITDCYSGGHTSNGTYVFDSTNYANVTGYTYVGGFVGYIVGPNYNGTCYSTCSVYNNGTTTQVVGLFSGLEVSDLHSGTSVVAYATGTAFAPAGMTPKLVPEPYLLTGNAIPRDVAGTVNAVPYDTPTLGDDYPFASGQTVHHGDWVEAETPAMAYIEKYDDGGYGIYAAVVGTDGNTVSRNINTLQSGDTVTVVDDFYRVICKKSISSLEAYLDDSTTAVDLEPDTTEFDPDGKTDDGYYVYNFDGSDDDAATATNYYHKLTFSGNTFYFNPNFACEAFDVTAAASLPDPTNKLEKPGAAGKDDTTTTYAEAGVIIRSARQLANIQKYTKDSAAQTWTYEQLLDVAFDTYTGSGLTAGMAAGMRLDPAVLTSGTYDGHGKKIRNLYIGASTDGAGLFAIVGESGKTYGTVTDVMLENVDVEGGADAPSVGGLVGTLYGKVENSGIYVSNAGKYSDFKVTGAGDNGVGGLIGQIFDGTVTGSFAAVKVEGTDAAAVAPAAPTNPVGGFVGHIHGGSITNCYAGGFVDKDSKNYKSDSVNVKGFNNVGGFVGSVSATATFAGVNYSTASVGDGSSNGLFAGSAGSNDVYISPTGSGDKLYAVAVAFDTVNDKVVAARDESAYLSDPDMPNPVTVTTERYNQTGDFPYGSGQTTHHGDWIVVKVMGLYYDTVDTTTGYYANGNKVTGVAELQTGKPGDGAVASDDGYMFISTADIGEIAITVGGKSYPMSAVALSNSITVGDDTYTYKYEVPADALNAPTENFYTVVSLDGRLFTANFGFAGEIYADETPKDELNTVKAKKGLEYYKKNYDTTGGTVSYSKETLTGSYAVIRTARQLANLGIRSNETTNEYSSTVQKVYSKEAQTVQKTTFNQILDIDYSGYNADKLPKVMPKLITGSTAGSNHVPITMAEGEYYGHEYIIKNLVPGMIDEGVFKTDGSLSEVLLESGLFGRVTGGTVDGVRLVNATVTSDASDVTGGGGIGSGKWDPTGDKSYTIKDNAWVNGLSISASSGGTTVPGGSEATYTTNGFTFTVKYSGNGKIFSFSDNPTGFKTSSNSAADGIGTHRKVQFAGGVKTTGDYVQFTTSHPALVQVWWQATGAGRNAGIATISATGSVSYLKKFTDTGTVETITNGNYYFEYEIESPGTYYVGSTGSSGILYGITVTEHTKESASNVGGDPTATHYADAAGKFKVRFGALVGAVNPADTTSDTSVTINNCGAYVDTDGTHTDYDSAYNAYVVKNNGANDTTGGLIGMATKGATIKSSFAAVKVTGVEYVGGFAGHLKNVTVVDCYSGGHTVKGIYSTTDFNVTATGGRAGGFAGRLEQTDGDALTFKGVSYSTCSAKGNTAGQFAGVYTDGWVGYESATTLYGIGSVKGDEVEEDYLNNFYVLAKTVKDTTVKAYPYDTMVLGDKKDYPYTTGTNQMEHHGDWTVRVNFIYYEVYEGSTDTGDNVPVDMGSFASDFTTYTGTDLKVGFYGVLNNGTEDGRTVNTLSTTGYVVDSGYMILSDDDQLTTLEFSINSRYKETDHIESKTFEESDRINLSDIGVQWIAKYGFIIPYDKVKLAPADQFYMPVTVNNQMYMLNPHFACEVVNIGFLKTDSDNHEINEPDYDTVRTKQDMKFREVVYDNAGKKTETTVTEDIEGIVIRSPMNFASMARYTRAGNTSQFREGARKLNYSMLMDVDYTKYVYGRVYDGNTNNRVTVKNSSGEEEEVDIAGSNYIHGQSPSVLNSGKFNGHGHTLSNLYLSNDTSLNFYVGLFGGLDKEAEVRNLVVDTLFIGSGTPASKYSKKAGTTADTEYKELIGDRYTYMGGVAAQVMGGSIIENVSLKNVLFDMHAIPTYNGNSKVWSLPIESKDDSLAPIRSIGGAVGLLIDGKVNNVTIDKLEINLKGYNHNYAFVQGNGDISVLRELKDGDTPESDGETTIGDYRSIVANGVGIYVGGAIGSIETYAYGHAMDYDQTNGVGSDPNDTNSPSTCDGNGEVEVSNVYVTDALISANRGNGNMVGGLIGRADGKAEGDPAVAGTRIITVSNSGVSLRDTDDMGTADDPFNTKYGVLDNGSKKGEAVGGFIGRSDNYVSISNCFSAIRVQGQGNVGGFAGDIEGSYIESCFSGGHTIGGVYDDSVANVTGVEANTAGGFAGKIEASDTLTFKGTIYTTSSVTNTTDKPVGRFQAGDSNVNAVAKAKRDGENVVLYAAGKIVGTGVNQIDEKGYLLTGALIPSNTNATFETKAYDPILQTQVAAGESYPYASSTKINTRGDDANPVPAHYGDWAEYAADGAFYWELEDGVYHFYTVTDDDSEVETDPGLCEERDGNSITKWGYGVFSHVDGDTSINIGTLTEDTDPDADAAKAELLKKYSTAKTVMMIQGKTEKSGPVEVKVQSKTFTINPAYAAAVEAGASGASTMGKVGNPYQIRTAQQLDNIEDSTDTHFKQTHDISGTDYTGTFTPNSLTNGEYNGRSYRILDLKIDAGTGDDAALFSALTNSHIKNTILYSTTFDANACTITGGKAAGIAVSMNGGSITDSIVAGYTVSGQTIGGLVAETQGNVEIRNSQATVRRSITEAGGNIGGLVGYVSSGTLEVTKSYAGGDVETAGDLSSATGKMSIGGIVGARHASSSATDTTKYVKYDTVYSYVAMAEDDIKFNTTKKKDSEGNNTSDYEYVTFYGIGPDVDTTKTDTIGYWSGGVLDPNTEDRDLGTALANLARWKDTEHEAKQVYMPNADTYKTGADALTNIVDDHPFIYGEYVEDAQDEVKIHYGDWPVASLYAGLFNWELERVTDAAGAHKDEYHFYAYGVELVRGELFESILLDNLCKDHHVNERATILRSGYGYFLPNTSSDPGSINFSFAVMKGTADNTAKFTFADEDDATHKDEIAAVKAALFGGADRNSNLHEVDAKDYNIHLLYNDENATTARDSDGNITNIGIEKFADVKDLKWKITADLTGGSTEAFDMRVYPTFGEAIYGDDFDMNEGNDDDTDKAEPMQVRTRLQFERLKANAESKVIDKIALSHDIDFAEGTAEGYRAGVDSCSFLDKDKSNYVPGQLRTKIFDGQGYRLIDVMISVNNKVESTKYTTDDLNILGDQDHDTNEIKDYNNPVGDAALFLNGRDSSDILFKNLVLYSPENTGVIETTVATTDQEEGYAAGIIARAIKDYTYYDKGTEKTRSNKYAFENCVVAGYTIKGYGAVGGIVGVATNDNTNTNKDKGTVAHPTPMKNCQVVADLVGTGSETYIGGLAGKWKCNVKDCYSGGSITLESGVTASSSTNIGGIVGSSDSDKDEITNCYTFMDFTGLKDAKDIEKAKIYPIAGKAKIDNTNSYFSDYVDGVTLTFNKDEDSKPVTLAEMIKARGDGDVAEYSYWLSNEPDYHGYVANEMGTFPFKAVVTLDGVGKVHYGKWPEGTQGAGVAYYEKYDDSTYGFQIVGIKPDGASLAFDNLCKDRHTDLNSNDLIVETGYLAFTTRAGKVTVGTDNTLSGIGSALDSAKAEEVKMELANALASNIEGISVYPTFKVTDLSSGNYTDYVLTPSVEVTAGTNKATVYYTNGFAGVSESAFGTEVNPVQIRTVLQLDNIQHYTTSSEPQNEQADTSGKFFKQTHDLYGEKYSGYTGVSSFKGTYDGDHYRILELSIRSTSSGKIHVGLFSSAGGTIRNVIMYSPSGDAVITNSGSSSSTSGDYSGTGGIVGDSNESLKVENCVVAGYTITGQDVVGGIVGYCYYGGTITGCEAVNNLTIDSGSGSTHQSVGGITGGFDLNSQSSDAIIDNCYAGGTIKATDKSVVGGLTGVDFQNSSSRHPVVKNSYSYVDISGTGAKAENIYTIGKGLDSSSENNYYLSDKLHVPDTCNTQGDALKYFEMCERVNTADKANETYVPDDSGNTGLTPNIQEYPFKAVVTDQDGKPVHYGEMPDHELITEAITGIFYWEKHGTDYQVQYIGKNESGADVTNDVLCKGRDGVEITESGFGYFYLGSGVTTAIDNEGDEVDSTALGNITNALKNNGVFNKVTVKAYKQNAAVTAADTWTVNGLSAAFDQRFAKVYAEGSAPKQKGDVAYAIRTAEQLSNIDSLNPGKEVTNYKFVQSHDVKFDVDSSKSYQPAYIGSGSEYDGQGYRILELSVSKADGSGYIGLFSRVKGTVKNVVLYSPSGNATISSSSGKYAGGIAGEVNGSTIENCVVAGYTIKTTQYAGGIAGQISNSGKIIRCQAVNALDAGGKESSAVGGIAGNVKGTIENCYAGGRVANVYVKSNELKTYVGGIYGKDNNTATAKNCYSYMYLKDFSGINEGKYSYLSAIGQKYNGTDCYYLKGNFQDDTSANSAGTELTATTTLSSPFGKAVNTYAPKEPSVSGGVAGDGTVTPLTDKTFPFPAIFSHAGSYEHYGTWVDATGSGDPGIPEGPSFEAAILPEKLILPDAEDKENKGGDGHTEYVSMRSFIARVHMLRS